MQPTVICRTAIVFIALLAAGVVPSQSESKSFFCDVHFKPKSRAKSDQFLEVILGPFLQVTSVRLAVNCSYFAPLFCSSLSCCQLH